MTKSLIILDVLDPHPKEGAPKIYIYIYKVI